jgi:hypothetical protein
MGCDIHAYIEKYSQDELKTRPDSCYVDCVAENLSFGRDYTLFGLLANVRATLTAGRDPLGIPKNPPMSYTCASHYYLSVYDSPPDTKGIIWHKASISREEAERYIANNRASYVNAEKNLIIDPSWHSSTHLTLDDMMLVRKDYLIEVVSYENELSGKTRKELLKFIKSKTPEMLMRYSFPGNDSPMLYSAIKMMQSLEQCSENGDIKTRFVCWFDS